jgi:hypothetical protein
MSTPADCAALEALADFLEKDGWTTIHVGACRRAADKLRRIEEVVTNRDRRDIGQYADFARLIEDILK